MVVAPLKISYKIFKKPFLFETTIFKIVSHPPLKSKLGLIVAPSEQGTTTKKSSLERRENDNHAVNMTADDVPPF